MVILSLYQILLCFVPGISLLYLSSLITFFLFIFVFVSLLFVLYRRRRCCCGCCCRVVFGLVPPVIQYNVRVFRRGVHIKNRARVFFPINPVFIPNDNTNIVNNIQCPSRPFILEIQILRSGQFLYKWFRESKRDYFITGFF